MTAATALELPSGTQIVNFALHRRNYVGSQESEFTEHEYRYVWPGQLWLLDVTFARRPWTAMRPLVGALADLHGAAGTLLLGDPLRQTPAGDPTQSGSALVYDAAAQTSDFNLIPFRGAANNATGLLTPADLFQFGSGATSRLYETTGLVSVDADGTGKGTIPCWPHLRETPADGAPIVTTNPKGLFRILGPDLSTPEGQRLFVQVPTIQLREAIDVGAY